MDYAQTIDEAAAEYGVTPACLYNLIKQGKLEKYKQDGKTLLSSIEVRNLFYVTCPICAKGFMKTNKRQRFCSQACRQVAARRREK